MDMPKSKEEAKKDLKVMVETAKAKEEKVKEASMSPSEKIKAETDKKKVDEAKIASDAKAKRDTEILNASDEDLKDPKKFSDEERALRPGLIEKLDKDKAEEEKNLSAEEKIKRIQKSSQERIDVLTNKLKLVEDKSSKEAEALRKELDTLKKEKVGPSKEDISAALIKEEQDRIAKYVEEDVGKPREQRREMSDEEWDDWNLESPQKAQEWLYRRTARRDQERNVSVRDKKLKVLSDKHHESAERTYVKHPELDIRKRESELIAEGTPKEKVFETLIKENPKLKVCFEIMNEHHDWVGYEDYPERIVAEMEKRIETPSSKKITDEDRDKRIEDLEAEIERLKNGDEGVNSNISPRTRKVVATEAENAIITAMTSMKASKEMIDSAIRKFREKNKG